MLDNKIDVLALQETRVASVKLNDCPTEWTSYNKPRTVDPSRGGGVAFIIQWQVKHNLVASSDFLETSKIEQIYMKIDTVGGPTILCNVYIPPGIAQEILVKDLIILKDNIGKLRNLHGTYHRVFLLGDMNAAWISEKCPTGNSYSKVWTNFLVNSNLNIINDYKHGDAVIPIKELVENQEDKKISVTRCNAVLDYICGYDFSGIRCSETIKGILVNDHNMVVMRLNRAVIKRVNRKEKLLWKDADCLELNRYMATWYMLYQLLHVDPDAKTWCKDFYDILSTLSNDKSIVTRKPPITHRLTCHFWNTKLEFLASEKQGKYRVMKRRMREITDIKTKLTLPNIRNADTVRLLKRVQIVERILEKISNALFNVNKLFYKEIKSAKKRVWEDKLMAISNSAYENNHKLLYSLAFNLTNGKKAASFDPLQAVKFYQELYSYHRLSDEELLMLELQSYVENDTETQCPMLGEVSADYLKECIRTLPNNKATGPDETCRKYVIYSSTGVVHGLTI
jgi:hypothetical protein